MVRIIRNMTWAKGISLLILVCLILSVLPQADAAAIIDNVTIRFENTTATVSGRISSGAGQFVGLEVVKPERAISETQPLLLSKDIVCYADQTASGSSGNFTFTFVMKAADPSGLYTFRINGANGANTVVMPCDYVNPLEIEESFEKINHANNQDELYNLLQNDAVVIRSLKIMEFFTEEYNGLPDVGKKRICDDISKGTKPYTSQTLKPVFNGAVAIETVNQTQDPQAMGSVLVKYNSFFSLALEPGSAYGKLAAYQAKVHELFINYRPYNRSSDKTALTALQGAFEDAVALTSLNIAVWGDVETILSKYNHRFSLNLTGDYAALSKDNQTLVQKELVGKGFKFITEVQTAFNNKVAALKGVDDSPVGTGGGSGGGHSSSTVSITSPVMIDPPPAVPNITFHDLTEALWAKDSIEELVLKGIVVGFENNEFRPNEKVTREQFTKMLMLAFNLSGNYGDIHFNDVQQDEWYYTYIAGAQQLGIISGYDDGSFGVGREISRQEMAVMAYRASQKAGIQLEQIHPAIVFNDGNSIADYAAQSVNIMQQAGVINGDEGNYFAPNDMATRAQAAKVIYTLLHSLKNGQ